VHLKERKFEISNEFHSTIPSIVLIEKAALKTTTTTITRASTRRTITVLGDVEVIRTLQTTTTELGNVQTETTANNNNNNSSNNNNNSIRRCRN